MRLSRGLWLLVLIAVIAVAAFLLFGRSKPEPHAAPPPAQVTRNANGDLVVDPNSPLLKKLVIQPAGSLADPHVTHFPGVVVAEPNRSVNILTPVAGRVLSVSVTLGQFVHAGQVLAVLASGDLAQAYSDQRKAQAALALAKKAFNRAQGVLGVGGNAVKDVDSARNDLAQAEAEAERTDQRMTALSARAEYSGQGKIPLVAPSDGIVSTIAISSGNMVTDPTQVQVSIVDLGEVWVNPQIPENQIRNVAVGQDAQVTLVADPGHALNGHVISIDPTLHPDSRRVEAHVACANPDGLLRPNMFADVAIAAPEGAQIVVPQSALLMNNDAVNVYVQVAPRTFRRQKIDISYDESDNVRVNAGLAAGTPVVTVGGIFLNDD